MLELCDPPTRTSVTFSFNGIRVYHRHNMKRDSRGRFAKELECGRETARPALYQSRWRAKRNLCTKCAKRPKAPGLSRCLVCTYGEDSWDEHDPEAVDLVPMLNPEPGKPSRLRSYRKMMKAIRSKKG
jgi:hypothetical protein